jgi:hypothetical protein
MGAADVQRSRTRRAPPWRRSAFSTTGLAADPTPMSPAQFAAVMRDDSKRYGAVIRERHITAT